MIMKKNMALVMASMMAALSHSLRRFPAQHLLLRLTPRLQIPLRPADTKAAPGRQDRSDRQRQGTHFTTGAHQGTYYGFGGVIAGQISDLTDTTGDRHRGERARKETLRQWMPAMHSLVLYSPMLWHTPITVRTFRGRQDRRLLHCGSALYGAGSDRNPESGYQDRG